VVVLALAVGLAGLTALLYAASVHAFPGDSDGATVILEGQSISTGHVTLDGWALSLDSFWSVDALFYALAELVARLRPALLHLVPAIIAALIILVGVVIARDGRHGAAGIAAVLTVVALLALPTDYPAYFFVRGPIHVGTTLWALAAFTGLRRGRFGLGWFLAVAFLAMGLLGDFQIAAMGFAPVFAAGVAATLRTRSWRKGAPMAAAAAAGVVLAIAVREIARLGGTYAIGKVQSRASFSQMLANLEDLPGAAVHMFGTSSAAIGNRGVPAPAQAIHLTGLLIVIAALVMAFAGVTVGVVRGHAAKAEPMTGHDGQPPAEDWRLDDLLLFGCLGGAAVFVTLSLNSSSAYDRYMTPAVIFGSILAGRMTGRWASAVSSRAMLRCAAIAGSAVLVAFTAGFAINVSQPVPVQTAVQLGQFLEDHGLDMGIGDYWSASITTVTTDGAVTVRPVIDNPSGRVVRYQRQSSASWYEGQSFQFLVDDTTAPGAIDLVAASATFGPPTQSFDVGNYQVLVWPYTISVPVTGYDPVKLQGGGGVAWCGAQRCRVPYRTAAPAWLASGRPGSVRGAERRS
jgi:hypothetical protein